MTRHWRCTLDGAERTGRRRRFCVLMVFLCGMALPCDGDRIEAQVRTVPAVGSGDAETPQGDLPSSSARQIEMAPGTGNDAFVEFTTYYVSPRGNDWNFGDQRQPFRTIQRAVDVAGAGDTVMVEDGTYVGTGLGTACESSTSRPVVCLTRGGTAHAWLRIRARHKGKAKIDGRSNSSSEGFRFLTDANYVQIEGFEIFGLGNPTQSAAGLELYDGGHDVIISDNHIHDIGRLCTDNSNGQNAIFVQQPRVTITRNVIHDIGRFAPRENGCLPLTNYYQNHDHGIYLDGRSVPGASDALITSNLFYNHLRGWAIQLYPGTLTGVSILNNTFAAANPYSAGHIIVAASMRNAQITNNIFIDPLSAAINFYAGTHVNLTVANNLSSGVLATATPATVRFANNLPNTDSKSALDDFRPTASSAAIDHGMRLPEVPFDIDGLPRPQSAGWDIGAYEMPSSGR
jgi:hypothetical protein